MLPVPVYTIWIQGGCVSFQHPPNVPPFRALLFLFDGFCSILKGSGGGLVLVQLRQIASSAIIRFRFREGAALVFGKSGTPKETVAWLYRYALDLESAQDNGPLSHNKRVWAV